MIHRIWNKIRSIQIGNSSDSLRHLSVSLRKLTDLKMTTENKKSTNVRYAPVKRDEIKTSYVCLILSVQTLDRLIEGYDYACNKRNSVLKSVRKNRGGDDSGLPSREITLNFDPSLSTVVPSKEFLPQESNMPSTSKT